MVIQTCLGVIVAASVGVSVGNVPYSVGIGTEIGVEKLEITVWPVVVAFGDSSARIGKCDHVEVLALQ